MGKYIFIEDSDQMDQKIVNLLQDSLSPYISDFNFEYDKEIIERILPLPNKIAPLYSNQPFRCYLFFNYKLDTTYST